VLHRLTGLALVGYLFLHIWVISFSTVKWGGVSFDMIMGQFQTPMFYVLDLGLLAVVLFHGLNGLRILLFDVGIGVRIQKQILWAVVFVVIIAELAAAYHAVPRIFG
jgi:succinate dehydrogenase / fumarate reductase cytochrome b subunit